LQTANRAGAAFLVARAGASVGTELANPLGMSRQTQDPDPTEGPPRGGARGGWRFAASLISLVWSGLGLAVMLWLVPWPAKAVLDTAPVSIESWRRLESVGGRGQQPDALAQSESGDVAVGDLAGISWWRDQVRERAVLPFVRDLAFDSRGVLWIATLDGLYFWHRSDRPTPRRLPGGEASNRIHRIAVSQSGMLVATGAGAFWSSEGEIFQRLRVSGVARAVSHVAVRAADFDRSSQPGVRPHPGRTQAWFFGAGRLSLVRGLEASSGMRVTDVQSLPLPRPGSGETPVDLVIDPSGRRLYFVFKDAIAWRSIENQSFSAESGGWHLERPGLPPGAVIRRLGWAAGRIWIATDHGLLEGQTLDGPFRRATSPVGTNDCFDIQSRFKSHPLVLCRAGIFALEVSEGGGFEALASSPPALSFASPPGLSADPPLKEIRRRALVRAGLTARRSQGMWERLRKRAFWPEVGLRFDVDFDYDNQRDNDQAFLSGDTRRLFDHSRDEGQSYQGAIELDWDLGGAVYPLESVDLSRELRQVVSLRDDVADEINQLYFERQSIREKLASSTPAPGSVEAAEATRLRWRAKELDAGLDAWTGGWISRWRLLQSENRAPSIFHSDSPRTDP
jgi:hypothetical protein